MGRPASAGDLSIEAVGAIVAPASALGGSAVLSCAERGLPVIAVQNPCVLNVDADRLGIAVLTAATYSEAAGLVLALREGISPASLSRPLPSLAQGMGELIEKP